MEAFEFSNFDLEISGSKFYLHLWRQVSHHSALFHLKIQLLNHVDVWQPTLRVKECRYTTNELPFQQETPWVKQRLSNAVWQQHRPLLNNDIVATSISGCYRLLQMSLSYGYMQALVVSKHFVYNVQSKRSRTSSDSSWKKWSQECDE